MLLSAISSGNIVVILMSVLASLFLVFCVLPIHEYAHAWMAYKMGDKSVKLRGYLTLNPLAHIDPAGAIMIALIGFGWGKPTPIDERNFKDPRKGIALTALAGPVANFLLGFVLLFIATVFYNISGIVETVLGVAIYNFLYISAQITINIGILTLLPIPGFDGFSVVSLFLTDKQYYTVMANQPMISFVVIFLLLFTDFITVPLSWLSGIIINLFITISALPFVLF